MVFIIVPSIQRSRVACTPTTVVWKRTDTVRHSCTPFGHSTYQNLCQKCCVVQTTRHVTLVTLSCSNLVPMYGHFLPFSSIFNSQISVIKSVWPDLECHKLQLQFDMYISTHLYAEPFVHSCFPYLSPYIHRVQYYNYGINFNRRTKRTG